MKTIKNHSLKIITSSIYIYILLCSFQKIENKWIKNKQNGYSLIFKEDESKNIDDYLQLFQKGKLEVESFFRSPFKSHFDVYIHPNRVSLDSTWQKDWGMPSFKSQCWMVASGVSKKLDIISPKKWDKLACEHSYSNLEEVQRLVIHELVHVYHGQHNKSHDFSNISKIDWLIEGLAVYASGQLDHERITRLKEYLKNTEEKLILADFWKGKNKYGLSGSLVKYIDDTYGRKSLIQLLKYNKLEDVLRTLQTSEEELISHWKSKQGL